jgi:hypothetical protein
MVDCDVGGVHETGEYGLMALLALGMCYVLLLSNGNARFGDGTVSPPPWPQPRQEVPGWLALHLAYVDRIAQATAGQARIQRNEL